MKIRTPNNLAISIYKHHGYNIIKFLNKRGVIKKKISIKKLEITKYKNTLLLKDPNFRKSVHTLLVYKTIITNLMLDLFKIFKDRLILEGVGYKVWKKKNKLKFKLGHSKASIITIPPGINVSIFKLRKITLTSVSSQYLRIFKHQLRKLREPDPYKKKGVRFYKEVIKLKEGKKSR